MYRLVRFGALSLEAANQVDTVGSGPTPTSFQSLPEGGALDGFGGAQKHPGAVERVKNMRLLGATPAALETRYYQLLEQRGTRNRLYRRRVDGAEQWKMARLVEVNAERHYELAAYQLLQDVELLFVTIEMAWHGTHHGVWRLDNAALLDAGLTLDAGSPVTLTTNPKSWTETIGSGEAGRAPVRDLQIIVTPGTADLTSVTLARAGGETLTWIGTLRTGQDYLLIDTGTLEVLVNGAEAYNGLSLGRSADLAAWFGLRPGANALTVTVVGGGTGATVELVYDEAWV